MSTDDDDILQVEVELMNIKREQGMDVGIKRDVEYIDPTPRPLISQIPLWEYFERIKRYKTDNFQKDLCARLQYAAENRHIQSVKQVYHAESQLGKTSVLTQAFSAWLFGHDPLFRYALMMFNVTRSIEHSDAVITILNSPVHKDIFQNKDGWLEAEKPSKAGWMTQARKELNDAQFSFNPCGLASGLTGTSFDWLSIDDPYANEKDAFSVGLNKTMRDRYEYTVLSRTSPHSCIAGMFHRYSPSDFAGYLLDTGDFEYIRYATVCDGDYIHEKTGQRFPDPLDRYIGEYISPTRRLPSYYTKVRKNNRVWMSMFMGRPSTEEGEFFNVGKIDVIDSVEAARRKANCVALVRAWDLAATEKGGDYSVGMLMGMESDGRTTVFDTVREQVETSGRDRLQIATAQRDGKDVIVTVPDDPGAGGTTTVFHIQQLLKGYEVAPRSTTGSKADRARNFAGAVNSGEVSFVDDSWMPEDKRWVETTRTILRDFPLAEFDDDVDSAGDAYNECYERKVKGLVVGNVKARNVVGWKKLQSVFPDIRPSQAVPSIWRIYIGVRITDEASKPNSALIVARASINANIGESLLVLAEYKKYDNNYIDLFNWLNGKLVNNFSRTPKENVRIFLHEESSQYLSTIKQKLNFNVNLFKQDNLSGLSELNWYLGQSLAKHPFYEGERAVGLYLIVDDAQLSVASNPSGLVNLRQEFSTWGFNDKGEPSQVGQLAECLRMVTYNFKTYAEPLTDNELVEKEIMKRVPNLALANISRVGKGVSGGAQMARIEEESRIRKQLGIEKKDINDFMNEETEIW